jgi:hypothetical protein
LITQDDVAELKRIDPYRAWEAEAEFAVGARWPFTRHQLRRTLALYAHRSGLVTLPSLKRQLQHITAEMSLYYARGSAFAKSFLDFGKKHFAQEWADARGLSAYLAYASQLLFSDERLFGGHAAWVQSSSVQDSPVSVFSRETTVAMFNRGELALQGNRIGRLRQCRDLQLLSAQLATSRMSRKELQEPRRSAVETRSCDQVTRAACGSVESYGR